jgi:hypothetical protein
MKIFSLSVFLFLGLTGLSHADESYTFVVQKAEKKAETRKGWNLSDWITQRDSMRTRDLWLAMHTPTPYEFFLGGDYRFLNEPSGSSDRRFQFGAFARIFGITLEHESEPNRLNALFNLRVFGLYQQGTNLTLFGGIRSQSQPIDFRSGVYGASLTFYLMRLGGIEASVRKYSDGTADPQGAGKGGTAWEANLFIDYKFFRIYGGRSNTGVDPARSDGYQIGGRFYF